MVSAIDVNAPKPSDDAATQVVHVLGLGSIGKHAFCLSAAQCQHQQITHPRQQILDEPTRVESSHHDFLHHAIQRFAVTRDDASTASPISASGVKPSSATAASWAITPSTAPTIN